jgi:hypothetical protein
MKLCNRSADNSTLEDDRHRVSQSLHPNHLIVTFTRENFMENLSISGCN